LRAGVFRAKGSSPVAGTPSHAAGLPVP